MAKNVAPKKAWSLRMGGGSDDNGRKARS
jgi:hypothetical protein